VPGSLLKHLRTLEQDLTAANVAIVRHFRPGLEEARIIDLLGGLGLTPSREAIDWFSWHDGAGWKRRCWRVCCWGQLGLDRRRPE
jgi:hypothetical protein